MIALETDILYTRVTSDEELHQILELQKLNILSEISEEEKLKEGFVTVHHTFEILKAMNDKCAHIVAKSNEKVVGYALCMVKDFKNDIEVLKPMFDVIEESLPTDENYIAMGQICVDKYFRKQGIFRGLYTFMKSQLQPKFTKIITEVDITNKRSLQAHYAIGFTLLKTYISNGQEWCLIFLE